MNIVFLIFAFIIFIILIIALIKDIKNAESIKKPDRSLPVGWFTKKSYWIYVIGIILLTFLTITFILFFTEMFFWLRFIFGILLLFIAVFFMTLFLQITPINKVLVRFEKTLNYEELKSSLDEFRKNDLAEDSRIYLDIIQANYLYMINLDEAIKILFEVKKPQNPSYVIQYYLIKLYGLLNQKDYEGFDKLYEDVIKDINEKKQNFWMKKFRDVKAIKEMHQQEVCDPIIEETFKLTGKTLFSDLANAIVLVKYYKLKKNEDEFIKYRDFILENGKPLYQLLADLENM
jgi:tetratricopeptide (TPR) repeat protein